MRAEGQGRESDKVRGRQGEGGQLTMTNEPITNGQWRMRGKRPHFGFGDE